MVKGKKKASNTLNPTGIEYGHRCLNTIIGCRHNCPWDCWAKRTATTRHKTRYGEDFSDIQWLPERLDQPFNSNKPQRVLVNFMGDMWGDWVPAEWIERTLDACDSAPWHDYLFLTKNPKRYGDYIKRFTNGNVNTCWQHIMPWLGTSVESGEKVQRLRDLSDATRGADVVKWVSLEPLIGSPHSIEVFDVLWKMDWIVIGALTGEGARQPDPAWVNWVLEICQDYDIPYFLKNNLDFEKLGIEKVQKYPKRRVVAD